MFSKSIVGILVNSLTLLSLILILWKGKPLFIHLAIYLAGIVFLFPLTIALEEFSHAGTCIARGKKSAINHLQIGYIEKNNRNILNLWAAIDYFGKFNQIDKFYISAGGPVTTLTVMLSLAIIVSFTVSDYHVVLIFFLNAAIPLVALIPSNLIMKNDGYSIREASKKLKIPPAKIPFELFKSMKFLLKYCISPGKEYHNPFVMPSDILENIDNLMQENRIADAIIQYEKLVSLEPYNSEFLNNLAWLYYENGEFTRALNYSKKAVKLSPRDEDFRDTLDNIKKALK